MKQTWYIVVGVKSNTVHLHPWANEQFNVGDVINETHPNILTDIDAEESVQVAYVCDERQCLLLNALEMIGEFHCTVHVAFLEIERMLQGTRNFRITRGPTKTKKRAASPK